MSMHSALREMIQECQANGYPTGTGRLGDRYAALLLLPEQRLREACGLALLALQDWPDAQQAWIFEPRRFHETLVRTTELSVRGLASQAATVSPYLEEVYRDEETVRLLARSVVAGAAGAPDVLQPARWILEFLLLVESMRADKAGSPRNVLGNILVWAGLLVEEEAGRGAAVVRSGLTYDDEPPAATSGLTYDAAPN